DLYSGLTVKKDVPRDKRNLEVLNDNEILMLAAICKKIDNHYKFPQDIEWASERGKLYILQTRSVTTLEEKTKTKAVVGTPILIGLGASPGIGIGPVKIVKDISEMHKVTKGDILVTRMTNPDMVMAMEKAAGIITDSGGATCFAGGTKILTNKGFFTMEQIHQMKDDNLFTVSVNRETLKTEWKKIKNTMKRKAPVWEVSVSQTGRSKRNRLKVTHDHKMLTFDKRNIVERKLSDMIDNNEFVCTVDKIPPLLNNDGGDGKELAYLAGSIFSDGNVSLSNRRGRVTFTQKDTELKKDFIKAVQNSFSNVFNYDINFSRTKKTEGFIRGEKIVGSANDYVCNRKLPAMILSEMRENISHIALTVPNEVLLSYMAGLIDGDGTKGSSKSGRLHIFSGKDDIVKSIIISCLRFGINPQVSLNRDNCYNIQFVEKLDKIIENTKRVKCDVSKRKFGTKMFAAKQIFDDIINDVNYLGRIKPYVKGNLLIDADKIRDKILSMASVKERLELTKIIDSDLRMQRIIKLNDLEKQDVYNIEVEDNHNYLVFTEMYTPVLVNNCHAAIVSRELSIPCIVGTKTATITLKEGQMVTVDATHGKVFMGEFKSLEEKPEVKQTGPLGKTRTLIKVNLAFPETAEKGVRADGVGLLRLEHMLTKFGYHPMEYIRAKKKDDLIKLIVDGVGTVAKAFYPKPVWVRSLDVRTDEYANMIGGDKEAKEANPMLGLHGIRRDLVMKELLEAEFTAIKQLYEQGLDNVGIMIPFSFDVSELVKSKEIAKDVGLSEKVKFGIMVEVPSCALSIEEYCKAGINFISFGSNDLTQLTLGMDRGNEELSPLFNEMHPGMKFLFAYVIETCKKYGVESSICGEAPSNRQDIVNFLVDLGITSLSVNIDAIDKVKAWVSEAER
ncbi:MAG: phosphoenolpyruvate synthase, partial [Candidatus Thermoplasmatota archaeon]|nr:phosphoenolpyruvate synthase [Candidatus Thermoplasmatota archaeon]